MNEQPSTARVALKWGGLLGIASILFSLILFLTDTVGNTKLGLISYALTIGGLVLAMRDYRTRNGGFMTYGEGLSTGTLTATVAGLLSSLFYVFYTTLIDTGVTERMMDQMRQRSEDDGLSEEQIEQQMSVMELFQSPGITFVVGVLSAALTGLLLSLLIALFMRRNKSNPFE